MKVVTMGELMLRLEPHGHLRFAQTDSFGVSYGGGEANVAVSLANFGAQATLVTKLPKHEIGQAAVNSLRRFGVDTSFIVRGGERVGIYFLEKGASQRPGKVIYDRAGSSFALAGHAEFDWDKIFEGADWFHFTGITPSLGGNAALTTLNALKAAKAFGIPVSCDLNYRSKLWSRESAREVMSGLMKYVQVCITNELDASRIFGIEPDKGGATAGKLNKAGYESVAKQLMEQFCFQKVAITLRGSVTHSDNLWAGMLYSGVKPHFSKEYAIRLVERVGGGDAFSAGLIYALLSKYDDHEAIEFATAASCLKHSVEGCYNMVTAEEVKELANNG
ncbi:MAG: sugar kinase [Firmicutes bacterium]|nr:sugar kinase [Bacillota bacterium]